MNPALPALIERLEKTTKQDHALDRLLECALTIKGDPVEALTKFDRSTGVWCRPSLTGNLNAAIKMCERVLPSFRWEVGATLSPGYGAHIERRTTATPAGSEPSGFFSWSKVAQHAPRASISAATLPTIWKLTPPSVLPNRMPPAPPPGKLPVTWASNVPSSSWITRG